MKKCERFILLSSIMLSAITIQVRAELSKEQMYSLFNQANEAFGSANAADIDSATAEKLYDKAILSYEKIIKDGQIENARLYYNLANAYLLKQDIGRAILNYRRAARLDSDNSDIQKNLAFAQRRRVDQIKIKAERRILRTLFFWHYDFSLKTRFLMNCICMGAICIVCAIMIWRSRRGWTTIIAVIAVALFAAMSCSVAVEVRGQNKICGVIIAAEVVAYQGDGENYPASFKEPLHAGTEFDLIQSRGGWLHIRLADDSLGWIREDAAELL